MGAKVWVIGRLPDCDVVVNLDSVSGHHCRLSEKDGAFILEDLRSRNGTYVNGVRLQGGAVGVGKGDRITLGLEVAMPWPVQGAPANRTTAARVIRIGRSADNDVALDYPMVSAHHAQLKVAADGGMVVEDLGSTNGTAVGRPEPKVGQAPVGSNDTVFFGSLPVPVMRLLAGKLKQGQQPQAAVAFTGRSMVFGRDPSCDHLLNAPMISWHHARLTRRPAGLLLEDLGSTNGTFVNGQRIKQAQVRRGSVIGLGSYTFTLTEKGDLQQRDDRGNVTLEARDVTVEVPRRRLLEAVSLTIFPSEFVGLMGPSGAGKTTLMNALNGYTRPTAGVVRLNGQSLYAYYAQFAAHIGYVPQDDIIHRDLTVRQALYYSARLRLPRDYTDDEIERRIAEVLGQLGLQGTEDVLIGSPEKKGISGGQRKRVNLAMELLTDPLVLFLDEPTSGLSSEDALTVMRLLRGLADAGKTILLTIHQPSRDVYQLMDNLAIVARGAGAEAPGRLVYYGPADADAIRFFNPRPAGSRAGADLGTKPGSLACADCPAQVTPDAILRGLNERPAEDWLAAYDASAYRRHYVEERAGQQPTATKEIAEPPPRPFFDAAQWWTLLRRAIAIKSTDTWNSAILLAQAPIIGLLIAIVYGKQITDGPDVHRQLFPGAVASALFLTALSCIWFGCSNAVREVIGEWAIYRRERMINLSLTAYVSSKFAILSGLCLLQCTVLLAIVHWQCSLQGAWLPMFGVLALASLVGAVLGLTISAAARTSEMAIALVPLVLLPMVIFGGSMQRIHMMGSTGRALCGIMASRWAFEGLFVLESDARGPCVLRPPEIDAAVPGKSGAPQRTDVAEGWFPQESSTPDDNHRFSPLTCIGILAAMLLGLLGGILGILRARDIH